MPEPSRAELVELLRGSHRASLFCQYKSDRFRVAEVEAALAEIDELRATIERMKVSHADTLSKKD